MHGKEAVTSVLWNCITNLCISFKIFGLLVYINESVKSLIIFTFFPTSKLTCISPSYAWVTTFRKA